MRTLHTDAKTGTESYTFSLTADADDPERSPTIEINCGDRQKPPVAFYRADVMLDSQIHDTKNYYAPAIWAWVKIDKDHLYRALWDIGPTPSARETKIAVLDRRTLRQLLRGSSMKVRFNAHNGQEFIDSFTIGGLDGEQIRDACGSKWFGKD